MVFDQRRTQETRGFGPASFRTAGRYTAQKARPDLVPGRPPRMGGRGRVLGAFIQRRWRQLETTAIPQRHIQRGLHGCLVLRHFGICLGISVSHLHAQG